MYSFVRNTDREQTCFNAQKSLLRQIFVRFKQEELPQDILELPVAEDDVKTALKRMQWAKTAVSAFRLHDDESDEENEEFELTV